MEVIKEALTFDDVLLVPKYSSILPSETNLHIDLGSNLKLKIPFLSSAMDTVTESPMAIAIAQKGGLGIIHRNLSIENQSKEIKKVKNKNLLVGAAVGTTNEDLTRAKSIIDAGVDLIVLDTAHGHSEKVLKMLFKIKKINSKKTICVGNIATAEAALKLYNEGADILKVGIGPGSICTTRIIAGVGYPQLSAVLQVAEAIKGSGVPIIADGGIRYTGDIPKAIAAGASCVMLGSLLAGTKESPGETIIFEGRKFKSYRGMGSVEAMNKGSKDRYFQDVEDDIKKLVPEGIVGRVPYKGELVESIHQFLGGLKAGMGYCGTANVDELRDQGKFVQLTASGIRESHPHNIQITKEAPNYSP